MARRGKRARRPASRSSGNPASVVAGQAPKARAARVPVRASIRLTDPERSDLNLYTLVSHRTIQNYAAGFAVSDPNRIRIERWMERRGIERKEREKTAGHGRRRRVVTAAAAHGAAA
jgi:hypothetical protein